MIVLKRVLAFGLLAFVASPAPGQDSCERNQSIGCEYLPGHGWVGYGWRPPQGPEYKVPELTPEQKAARKKAERDREERERELIETNDLFRRARAALPYWIELPPGGTCLADSHARPGVDPRHAYTETRKSCAAGDLIACDALLNACTPDVIDESKRGTCFSSYDSASRYASYTGADLWELQDTCEVGRDPGACSLASRIHSFAQLPEAIPQQAYHYAYFACKYGADIDCEGLFASCIGPVPNRSGLPPRRERHYVEGSCSWPKFSRSDRKELNLYEPEALTQQLRENQRACFRGNPDQCVGASVGHALLTVIPEAKPQDAYYFMWLACQQNSNYCQDLKRQCTAAKR